MNLLPMATVAGVKPDRMVAPPSEFRSFAARKYNHSILQRRVIHSARIAAVHSTPPVERIAIATLCRDDL